MTNTFTDSWSDTNSYKFYRNSRSSRIFQIHTTNIIYLLVRRHSCYFAHFGSHTAIGMEKSRFLALLFELRIKSDCIYMALVYSRCKSANNRNIYLGTFRSNSAVGNIADKQKRHTLLETPALNNQGLMNYHRQLL